MEFAQNSVLQLGKRVVSRYYLQRLQLEGEADLFKIKMPSKVSGIERRFFIFKNKTNDPHFTFELKDDDAGFLLLYFSVVEGDAAPKLYFDYGAGFNEEGSILLSTLASLYHLPLSRFQGLRALRFDPSEEHLRFRFISISTNSAMLAGALSFLMNKNEAQGLPSGGGSSVLKKTLKIIQDAPSFFQWIRSAESFYALSRRATMPSFLLQMSALSAKHASKFLSIAGAKRSVLIDFICPVYNARKDYLEDLIESFTSQRQSDCRLIFSDDKSSNSCTIEFLKNIEFMYDNVSVIWSDLNEGISKASNKAIAQGDGTWISFIDHDDAFAPNAIGVIKAAIDKFPGARFIYTDEYIADENLNILDIFCKPAYDVVLLTGMNYINHFSIFSRSDIVVNGLLDSSFDGSQDYELLFRVLASISEDKVVHIPFPAYIWRRPIVSYSVENIISATKRARLAIKENFARYKENVEVVPASDVFLHKVVFHGNNQKSVSIVIPNRNSFDLISRLLRQLVEMDAQIVEIIVVDNGSDHPEVMTLYEEMKNTFKYCRFDFIYRDEAFNFSAMCNRGIKATSADNILLLNNDIELLNADWLTEMLQCLKFPGTGIVGAKLLYSDNSVQHNGVIVGLGGYAGHWYVGAKQDDPGPFGRLQVRQSMTAVTGACMLITRECFTAVEGFDENGFPVAYNDVDFCIKANKKGYRIVFTPFAKLIHHESKTRGLDDLPENVSRFESDKELLASIYDTKIYDDAAFSPLYGRWHSYPSIRLPASLPEPRLNRQVDGK